MFGCVRFLGNSSVFSETLCFCFKNYLYLAVRFGLKSAVKLHNRPMLHAQPRLFYLLFLAVFIMPLPRCKSFQSCPFSTSLLRLLSE